MVNGPHRFSTQSLGHTPNGRTPHLDPLPFRRREETPRAQLLSTRVQPTSSFLSPIGGEDQGEGATTLTTRPGAFKPIEAGAFSLMDSTTTDALVAKPLCQKYPHAEESGDTTERDQRFTLIPLSKMGRGNTSHSNRYPVNCTQQISKQNTNLRRIRGL